MPEVRILLPHPKNFMPVRTKGLSPYGQIGKVTAFRPQGFPVRVRVGVPNKEKIMYGFHVKYYYLASGMGGRADKKDYGIIYADSGEEAINKVIEQYWPGNDTYTKEWIRGCLSAEIQSIALG